MVFSFYIRFLFFGLSVLCLIVKKGAGEPRGRLAGRPRPLPLASPLRENANRLPTKGKITTSTALTLEPEIKREGRMAKRAKQSKGVLCNCREGDL